MTSKAGHTAGPAKVERRAGQEFVSVCDFQIAMICDGDNKHREANAELIAEAFTVAHETGLTPRQLAERCAKLEAALQTIIASEPHDGDLVVCDFDTLQSVARAAIAKATAGKLTDDEIVELTSREAALGPDGGSE